MFTAVLFMTIHNLVLKISKNVNNFGGVVARKKTMKITQP